jgi:hypothetical protein
VGKNHFCNYNLMSVRMLTCVLVWIKTDIINKLNNISPLRLVIGLRDGATFEIWENIIFVIII